MTDQEMTLDTAQAEEACNAIAMYDSRAIPSMQSILQGGKDDFSSLRQAAIWLAVLAVYDRGDEVDYMSVAAELRDRQQLDQIGGQDRLFHMQNSVMSALPAETYARIVERGAVKRIAIQGAQAVVDCVYKKESDTADVVAKYHEVGEGLSRRMSTSNKIVRGDMLVINAMEEFQEWVDNPSPVRGLSCGIKSVDALIQGFWPETVTGILAETSMGKSTFCAGTVRNFAKQGRGLYMPTETPGVAAFHKMALDLAGIPYKQARAGNLTPTQRNKAMACYQEILEHAGNIELFDDSSPSIEAIRAKVIQMLTGEGCSWICFDSGSKFAKSLSIAMSGDNLYKATTIASGFMQDLARMGPAVVSTWQIGRNTKDRNGKSGTGKEPTLHDAKDSGAIEEDCDVILGLYRHDYFVKRKMADADELKYPSGTAKVLLLKDRAGSDGDDDVTLGFEGGKGFTDNVKRIDLNQMEL